jgi:anti-anti-sigma factor
MVGAVTAAPQFEVLFDDDGVCIVRGELDEFSGTELDAALASHDDRVVLDLGEVSFVDSAGLRTLLLARQERVERGGSLHVRRSSGAVRRVMRLAGVAHLFSPDGAADPGSTAAG